MNSRAAQTAGSAANQGPHAEAPVLANTKLTMRVGPLVADVTWVYNGRGVWGKAVLGSRCSVRGFSCCGACRSRFMFWGCN